MNNYLYIFLFTVTSLSTFGQIQNGFKLPEPKRLIDKVEVFVGPSLYFPDDNGWSKRIYNGSQGLTSSEFKKKFGYLAGFGITHSIGNHIEINGRLAWDRKGYLQEDLTLGDNNNVYKYEANARNDYLTGIIAPNYFIDKMKKFYLSSGIFYSHLSKSIIKETSYLNYQITQRSTITNSPEISDYDAGVLFAIGYFMPINRQSMLGYRLQFSYGLTDIINVNGLVVNSNSLQLLIILKYDR